MPATAKTLTQLCTATLCAKPDDNIDDTAAIQAAMDKTTSGGTLVFPPGQYLISKSLRVRNAGATFYGTGATIHGTNPDDQAIIIESDNTSIYNFRLTAVTNQRGSVPEQTRIAIYGPEQTHPIVKNTIIRGNQIVNAGAAGTSLANSSTGAGMLIYNADGFVIAENTVARTLADGIHMTGGSRNGRVLNNTVKENGDDMIAMVSYAYDGDPVNSTAADIVSGFAANQASQLVQNILVAGNNVSGQYWGRGITVVGGKDITIRSNTLTNIPYAAGILLAREVSYGTFGVNNVIVEKNTITDVQTLSPPYNVGNIFSASNRTGQGAIEISNWMYNDELGYPALVAGFAVGNIAVRNNTITSTDAPGVRVGVAYGTSDYNGSRAYTGSGSISNLSISSNTFSKIGGTAINIITTASGVASCTLNALDVGSLASVARCLATTVATTPTGAALSCPKKSA